MIALLLIYYISFVGHARQALLTSLRNFLASSLSSPSSFFCGHLLIAPRMRANLFIMRFHNGLHSNKCASFTAALSAG